jgi:predicted transcriptional regulator
MDLNLSQLMISCIYAHYETSLDVIYKQVQWAKNCTLLVIDDKSRFFGYITHEIMLEALKKEYSLKAKFAWEVCNRDYISVPYDLTLKDIAREMLINEKYHAVIFDENNLPISIITAHDLIRDYLQISLREEPSKLVNDYGTESTLKMSKIINLHQSIA